MVIFKGKRALKNLRLPPGVVVEGTEEKVERFFTYECVGTENPVSIHKEAACLASVGYVFWAHDDRCR